MIFLFDQKLVGKFARATFLSKGQHDKQVFRLQSHVNLVSFTIILTSQPIVNKSQLLKGVKNQPTDGNIGQLLI